jgi:hypothetical protein
VILIRAPLLLVSHKDLVNFYFSFYRVHCFTKRELEKHSQIFLGVQAFVRSMERSADENPRRRRRRRDARWLYFVLWQQYVALRVASYLCASLVVRLFAEPTRASFESA